jgi:hypothetical protein
MGNKFIRLLRAKVEILEELAVLSISSIGIVLTVAACGSNKISHAAASRMESSRVSVPEEEDPAYWSKVCESSPPETSDRLRIEDRALQLFRKDALKELGLVSQTKSLSVIDMAHKWNPGDTLIVAFQNANESGFTTSGDLQDYQESITEIERIAKEWMKGDGKFSPNLTLKFHDTNSSSFFEWSKLDTKIGAQIRITLSPDPLDGKIWSKLGTRSIDSTLIGKASMGLGGLSINRVQDYRRIVLHEFGHALGFAHEHQDKEGTYKDELVIETPPEYKETYRDGNRTKDLVPYKGFSPGVKLWFSGSPNFFSADRIENDILNAPDSAAFKRIDLDPRSVMKYYIPDFLFKDPKTALHTSSANIELSGLDIEGVISAYPTKFKDIKLLQDMKLELIRMLKTKVPEFRNNKFKPSIIIEKTGGKQ